MTLAASAAVVVLVVVSAAHFSVVIFPKVGGVLSQFLFRVPFRVPPFSP